MAMVTGVAVMLGMVTWELMASTASDVVEFC